MNDHYWAEKKAEQEDAMNPIEKLREDVFDIIGFAPGEVLLGPETQMFHDHARIVRKVMHRLDAFASEWEAKEVATWRGPNPHRSEVRRYWAEPESACSKVRHEATTILVPRKKPGLREAAEAVEQWCRYTNYWRGMPPGLHRLCDALAAALKEDE